MRGLEWGGGLRGFWQREVLTVTKWVLTQTHIRLLLYPKPQLPMNRVEETALSGGMHWKKSSTIPQMMMSPKNMIYPQKSSSVWFLLKKKSSYRILRCSHGRKPWLYNPSDHPSSACLQMIKTVNSLVTNVSLYRWKDDCPSESLLDSCTGCILMGTILSERAVDCLSSVETVCPKPHV